MEKLSAEQLTKTDRQRVMDDLMILQTKYPKLKIPKEMIKNYSLPPHSPNDYIFAKTTTCISSNFEKPITPYQFNGNPNCTNCNCITSTGLATVDHHTLPDNVRIDTIFNT